MAGCESVPFKSHKKRAFRGTRTKLERDAENGRHLLPLSRQCDVIESRLLLLSSSGRSGRAEEGAGGIKREPECLSGPTSRTGASSLKIDASP